MVTRKYHPLLDESLYMKELSSGIKCYIIPKIGYMEKQVLLAARYGSADTRFEADESESRE
ncbi:MAG: hypothetical protein LBT44_07320 [Clostridiales bacterium]|jgi:hypothetical protein|nr:hypothetical protein [Clostridiales bacterium]